jgi:hypothetical protein
MAARTRDRSVLASLDGAETPKPSQAMASLSANRRRDIYIFIAAIIFLSVVYFLARFAESWLS